MKRTSRTGGEFVEPTKSTKQRRRIAISVLVPVSVYVTVERTRATADDEAGDWLIASVEDVRASCTVTTLNENMTDDDHDELVLRAEAAKDET